MSSTEDRNFKELINQILQKADLETKAEEEQTTASKQKWELVCRGYNPEEEGSEQNTFAFKLYQRVENEATKLEGADKKERAYNKIMGNQTDVLKSESFFNNCIAKLVNYFPKANVKHLWKKAIEGQLTTTEITQVRVTENKGKIFYCLLWIWRIGLVFLFITATIVFIGSLGYGIDHSVPFACLMLMIFIPFIFLIDHLLHYTKRNARCISR